MKIQRMDKTLDQAKILQGAIPQSHKEQGDMANHKFYEDPIWKKNQVHSHIILSDDERKEAIDDFKKEKLRKSKYKTILESKDYANALSEMVLSDFEVACALLEKRWYIHARLKGEELFSKCCSPATFDKKFNANELYNYIVYKANAKFKATGARHTFELDDFNKNVITQLLYYFSSDEKFLRIDDSFSFGKGIFLQGPIGCGKTFIMRLFSGNHRKSYRVMYVKDIEADYSSVGESTFEKYASMISSSSINDFGQSELAWCFDDLGVEKLGKHFGKEAEVLLEILDRYYTREKFRDLYVTTNLSFDQIQARYGIRLRDRIREMFNVISFPLLDLGAKDNDGNTIYENKTRRR